LKTVYFPNLTAIEGNHVRMLQLRGYGKSTTVQWLPCHSFTDTQ